MKNPTIEIYYAIRIGQGPGNNPYFMLDDAGYCPALYNTKEDARAALPGRQGTIVKVRITELHSVRS